MKSLVMALAMLATVGVQALAESEGTQSTLPALKSTAPVEKKNAIGFYINPVYALLSTLRTGVDFGLSDTFSLGLNAQIMPEHDYSGTGYYYNDPIRVSRYDLGVDTTIMITGALNKRGLYISPAAGYSQIKAKTRNVEASLDTPYVEATVGYQWVWSHFRMAFGGGPVYHFTNKDIVVHQEYNDGYGTSSSSTSTVKTDNIVALSIDANIGFIF